MIRYSILKGFKFIEDYAIDLFKKRIELAQHIDKKFYWWLITILHNRKLKGKLLKSSLKQRCCFVKMRWEKILVKNVWKQLKNSLKILFLNIFQIDEI